MLSELDNIGNIDRKCVRVTGFVSKVDMQGRTCVLSHKGHNLLIDVTLVDITVFGLDSLCQVIGELRNGHEKVKQAVPAKSWVWENRNLHRFYFFNT